MPAAAAELDDVAAERLDHGHVIRLEVTDDKRDNPLAGKSQDHAPRERRLPQTRETEDERARVGDEPRRA